MSKPSYLRYGSSVRISDITDLTDLTDFTNLRCVSSLPGDAASLSSCVGADDRPDRPIDLTEALDQPLEVTKNIS